MKITNLDQIPKAAMEMEGAKKCFKAGAFIKRRWGAKLCIQSLLS